MSAGSLDIFKRIEESIIANFDKIEAAARKDLEDAIASPGGNGHIALLGRITRYYYGETGQSDAEMYFAIRGETGDYERVMALQELRKRCDAAAEEFRTRGESVKSALVVIITTKETEDALLILAGVGSKTFIKDVPEIWDAIDDAISSVDDDKRKLRYYVSNVSGNIFGVSEEDSENREEGSVEG